MCSDGDSFCTTKKILIGVGVSVGVLLLFFIVWWCVWCARQSKRARRAPQRDPRLKPDEEQLPAYELESLDSQLPEYPKPQNPTHTQPSG
ncbi:hypothetical protein AX16_002905 [Volvariella volvacea WC 439]|nr:hypothetical protein AX16_002905 [Volvariella volvacea WC 439]